MTHSLRSLSAVASAAALIGGLLTGCGGHTDSADSTSAPQGKKLAKGEVAQITFLHRIPNKKGNKTVGELIDEFNKTHPQIKVTPERMQGSAGESYAKINSIVQAGTDVPCLTQIGNERVADMIPAMEDVHIYTDKYKNNYLPAFYAKAKVGNKVFGFPAGASPLVFFYREDLFKKYGLTVPKTWAEYKKDAEIVRQKSGNKAYMGGFFTDEEKWVYALTNSEGANWFDFDKEGKKWTVNIDSPQSQKVAHYWDGLVKDKLVIPTQRWGQDFGTYLGNGTVVSTIGGPWEAPLIADTAPATKGLWRVAPIPHFTEGEKAVGQNGGTIVAVLKGCKYPKQAVEFANWWATNIKGLSGLGLLPASKVDKIETPANLKAFFGGQEIYDVFIPANNAAPEEVWIPKIGETIKVLNDEQGKVGSGGTVAEELTAGQAQALTSLKAAGVKAQAK